MKSRIRFILCSFLFLSLAGLGEQLITSCPAVKYYKQTEWAGTANLKEKDLPSFHYLSWFKFTATHPTTKSWSKESIHCFNQKISAEIIVLTKAADARAYPAALILNNPYIPRRSIEYPITACKTIV